MKSKSSLILMRERKLIDSLFIEAYMRNKQKVLARISHSNFYIGYSCQGAFYELIHKKRASLMCYTHKLHVYFFKYFQRFLGLLVFYFLP